MQQTDEKNVLVGILGSLLLISLGFNYYLYQQLKPYLPQINQKNIQLVSGMVFSVDAKNIKIKNADKEMNFSVNYKTKVYRILADINQSNVEIAKIGDIKKDMYVNVGYDPNKKNLAVKIDIYVLNSLLGKVNSIDKNNLKIDQLGNIINIKLTDKTTYFFQEYIKDGTAQRETGVIDMFKPGDIRQLQFIDIVPGQAVTVFLSSSVDDSDKTASKILITEYK